MLFKKLLIVSLFVIMRSHLADNICLFGTKVIMTYNNVLKPAIALIRKHKDTTYSISRLSGHLKSFSLISHQHSPVHSLPVVSEEDLLYQIRCLSPLFQNPSHSVYPKDG